MEPKSEMMKQFVKWENKYDWGVIIIGPDVSGFLILYGINVDDRVCWNTRFANVVKLEQAIDMAVLFANEIGKDPIGYLDSVRRPAFFVGPPNHVYCRCHLGQGTEDDS